MDDIELCLNPYFTDEPPHIRPFIFQPRYHLGLNPAYHPAIVHTSRPPPPPPRQRTKRTNTTAAGMNINISSLSGLGGGVVAKEMLWSSVALFGPDGSADGSNCFSLGLLGGYL